MYKYKWQSSGAMKIIQIWIARVDSQTFVKRKKCKANETTEHSEILTIHGIWQRKNIFVITTVFYPVDRNNKNFEFTEIVVQR